MRFGISIRGISKGSYAISTIVLHLTKKIIANFGNKHEIILYGNSPQAKDFFPEHVNYRFLKINNRFIWDQVWLPNAMKRDQVDIALFMKGTMPLFLASKGAVIFHDLGYFDKELKPYRSFETIYMKLMMRKAARQACVVFADSKYTKNEVLHTFDINPKKVHVCYQDIAPSFKPENNQNRLKEAENTYHLPKPFILCPISLSPRKNLPGILKAFESVQENLPHHLVLTGGKAWGTGPLLHKQRLTKNQRIHILGHVPTEDMPALYSLASFTLYPSLLEGFGMPVLEALRCECPVLTSNITSMPEIAGDAAYLVDPYDIDQIAAGIKELATNQDLRSTLIKKSYEQAGKFSWDKTAQIIVEKLEECHNTNA